MILNVSGGSAGYNLAVTVTGIISGTTVTVTKDSETYTKTVNSTGATSFNNLSAGVWMVTATNGLASKAISVNIEGDSAVTMKLRYIPEFTYDGTCTLIDDSDATITNPDTYIGNWRIKCTATGDLTFTDLHGAINGIDVFLVGGGAGGNGGNNYYGGGGGGGGYTRTVPNLILEPDTPYEVKIGAGGSGGTGSTVANKVCAGGAGGASSFAGYSAGGGKVNSGGIGATGGNGGSGGGAGSRNLSNGSGGTNGNNGGSGEGDSATISGGKGQRNTAGPNGETGTTREFGNSSGKLYSKGGNGGKGYDYDAGNDEVKGSAGTSNTGNAGGGGTYRANGGKGGSGIVIIRNSQEVA